VALDQNLTPAPGTSGSSAIDNEIASYRAINPHAVISLILGILSLLTFTNLSFLLLAATAVVFGVYANRRIRRDPEIWTGRGMAQAGIALGITFGLAAVTQTQVQSFLRSQSATRFAKYYAGLLKEGKKEEAVWYTVNPTYREGKSASEVYAEVAGRNDPRMTESQAAIIKKIQDRLASGPKEDIHFVKLEDHGVEGLATYALALLELHGPGSKEYPEKEEFALLVLKSQNKGGKVEWWLDSTQYPYVPSSYAPAAKPVDDGHGHAH
jgi:hypothetical protein